MVQARLTLHVIDCRKRPDPRKSQREDAAGGCEGHLSSVCREKGTVVARQKNLKPQRPRKFGVPPVLEPHVRFQGHMMQPQSCSTIAETAY